MDQQGESSRTGRNNGDSESRNAPNGAGSRSTPSVIVIDRIYRTTEKEPKLDLEKDLWLTTADGRYSGNTVPVRVGPSHSCRTFNVHQDVLLKSTWFQKALCGNFREAEKQAIDLPEEDPDIFHFVVAYLYEERYTPIRSAASALEPVVDKGKGRADDGVGPDERSPRSPSRSRASSSSSSVSSRSSASRSRSRSSSRSSSGSSRSRSRSRRGHRRRRHSRRHPSREKQFGRHRRTCACPQCNTWRSTFCWSCGVRLSAPEPGSNSTYPRNTYIQPEGWMRPQGTRRRGASVARGSARKFKEVLGDQDMQTWLMTYELNIDVYICAVRYLVDGLQNAVKRSTIDMLEAVGPEAAKPTVLQLCSRLYAGVPETDPLLAMVLARVGFLQPLLWKQAPQETSDFLVQNPEVAALMVREMATRHHAEAMPEPLLSMEAPPAEESPTRIPHRRRRRGSRRPL